MLTSFWTTISGTHRRSGSSTSAPPSHASTRVGKSPADCCTCRWAFRCWGAKWTPRSSRRRGPRRRGKAAATAGPFSPPSSSLPCPAREQMQFLEEEWVTWEIQLGDKCAVNALNMELLETNTADWMIARNNKEVRSVHTGFRAFRHFNTTVPFKMNLND